jgi:hypothetical protein
MRQSRIPIFYILSLCLLSSLSAKPAFAEVNIEASVNPAKVAVGDPVELTIAVTGASGGIKAPKLPELKGFRSYSQGHSEEFSFVNGRSTSRSVFTYVLVPSEEGVFTIDSIEVPINGKVFKTGNLKIEVGPTTAARPPTSPAGKPIARVVPPSSRSMPPDYMASQEIFVRAWSDREEAYVNQPIYLTYTLYTRTSATFKGFEDEPETAGFWVEDFPPNPQVSRQERNLGGYRYVIADVRQVALFPTEAGVKRFNPGSLKVDAEIVRDASGGSPFAQSSFFGRRYNPARLVTEIHPRILETEPINFNIKPLPIEGKPADFSGAVGHFKIEASLDQIQVEEGHPVTLKLRVTGEGNLNTLDMPKPVKMDSFKSYDSSSGLNLNKERMTVEGEKTLETVLVPRRAGDYTFPAIPFSFFDPVKEQYVTLQTRPMTLKVTPAPEGEASQPEPAIPSAPAAGPTAPSDPPGLEGIRFVKANQGAIGHLSAPPMTGRIYWLLQISAFLTALVFLVLRLSFEKLGINLLGAKPKRFKGEAQKHFRIAKRAVKGDSEKEFFEAVSRGVYGYFADKLRIEIGGVGIARVEEALRDKLSPEEIGAVRDLFHRIDYGRFAQVKMSQEERKNLYGEAERIVSLMEKKRL